MPPHQQHQQLLVTPPLVIHKTTNHHLVDEEAEKEQQGATDYSTAAAAAAVILEPDVQLHASQKLAVRIAKYGAKTVCSLHDCTWTMARLPFLCSILGHIMLGQVSFSENRYFLHDFLGLLLKAGDAFAVYQEKQLALAHHHHHNNNNKNAWFADNKHVLLVYTGTGGRDNSSNNTEEEEEVEVNARHSTSVLNFVATWPGSCLPSYIFDMPRCPCDIVQVGDRTQMARALSNCAATFVMRPGGCVTGLYYVGQYLATAASVTEQNSAMVRSLFDLD